MKKNLKEFQEEIRFDREQKEREKKDYFYLDMLSISDECYEHWKKVLKFYDLKEHDKIPIWLKDFFIPF